MARATKTPSKRPQLVTKAAPAAPVSPPTPFDMPQEAAVAVEESPTAAPTEKPRKTHKIEVSFWEKMRAIPPAEWGENGRTFMYLYLWQPYTDIKSEGKPGYLMKFYQPVDQDAIMKRYGSGQYHLILKHKKAGQKGDDTVDEHTFEIYNHEFPPKIPKELWKNDSRNDKWAALLPKEKPAEPQSAAGDPAKMLDTFLNIQDRIAERMEPQNGNESTNGVLDTAARLIELTRPKDQPAAAAIDPWAAAERILNMRSDNPMVTILQGELTALRHSLDEERKERIELQNKMWEAKLAALEAKMAPAASPAKSLVEQIKELTTIKSEVANLLGFGTDGAAAPRSRMSGTMEFWKDLVTEVINAPVLNGVGQMLLSRFMQGAPGMAVPGANPAQNGVAQSPAVNLIQWVQGTLMEPIVRFLNGNSDGGDFADYVFEGWPDRLVPLQRMTHPQMPGQTGAPVIIELFKHSDIWQTQLAYRETQFRQFVQEFCAWRPEGEPEPAPQTAANPHVPQDRSDATPIDLDSEEAGKGEEVRP